jgi:hypothetical protein
MTSEELSEILRLKNCEIIDLRDYIRGCSELAGGDGLLAVRISRIIAENERLTAEVKRLDGLLEEARPYVAYAYDYSFPDEAANRRLLSEIDQHIREVFDASMEVR